jgi:hypothetical protein
MQHVRNGSSLVFDPDADAASADIACDDAALVDEAKRNPDAFAALYERYRQAIYVYCFRRLSSPATPAPPRPIARNHLEGIAQAHRMWMSCVLAEAYFQVWALEVPDYVRAQVLIGIQSLSPEEQRAGLEDLETSGARENGLFFPFSQRGYSGADRIHAITDDPENSIQGTFIYRVGYASYSPEGMLIRQASLADDGPITAMVDSCNSYLFTWNDTRATWLIYDAPNCE